MGRMYEAYLEEEIAAGEMLPYDQRFDGDGKEA